MAVTEDQASRKAWLEGRRKGIGGSDVAAIMGLSKWGSPLDVYNEKLGLNPEEKSERANQSLYWGTVLEDTVAKEFAKRTGFKVQRVNHQFSDPEEPWMMANIDRAIINPEICKSARVLKTPEERERHGDRLISTDIAFEAKTANAFAADEWGPSQETEIVQGEVKTEHEIPIYYETQVQWYCGVLRLRGMYLAVLIGGSDFRMYWIEADPAVFETLKDVCSKFWKENVLKKEPPAPISEEDAKKLGEQRLIEDALEATGELAINYGEFARISGLIKGYEKQKEALRKKIALEMLKYQTLTLAGKKVLTYRFRGTTHFDSKRLKEDDPELYEEYVIKGNTREMRLAE